MATLCGPSEAGRTKTDFQRLQISQSAVASGALRGFEHLGLVGKTALRPTSEALALLQTGDGV